MQFKLELVVLDRIINYIDVLISERRECNAAVLVNHKVPESFCVIFNPLYRPGCLSAVFTEAPYLRLINIPFLSQC